MASNVIVPTTTAGATVAAEDVGASREVQLIKLLGWNEARGTLLIPAGDDGMALAAAGVVGISWMGAASHAR